MMTTESHTLYKLKRSLDTGMDTNYYQIYE